MSVPSLIRNWLLANGYAERIANPVAGPCPHTIGLPAGIRLRPVEVPTSGSAAIVVTSDRVLFCTQEGPFPWRIRDAAAYAGPASLQDALETVARGVQPALV
jgi:hypothetical protein